MNGKHGGIGLLGLVFLVFLVLKLLAVGEVAAWSWWGVTAPLWGPLALVLAVLALLGVVWLIATLAAGLSARRRLARRRDSGGIA